MFGAPTPNSVRESQIHRDGYRYGFLNGYCYGRGESTPVDSVAKVTGYAVLAAAAGFLGMKLLAPTADAILNR